ncbi:hypothetical protein FRB96_008863 [Tulasnella sp. 330]|nr:hypothetical protein FRB96_008863 [Tulasnella sp. 330]
MAALFGTEPQAFGAMVGAFTALYKIILNILPILRIRWNRTRDLGAMGGFRTTFDYGADERSARPIPPGLTKPADLVPYPSEKSPPTEHMPPITREGSHIFEPLRAAAAGSIAGGIAILLEKPSNRTSLGQQILVRIQSITFSPLEAIKMNRSLVLTGRFEPEHLETLLDGRASPWKGRNSIVTPQNRVVMLEQLARAKAGDFSPLVASCKALHPHCTDCVPNTFIRVYNVAMRLLPWYTSLHLIPALLLRWRQVLRDPARSALKVVAGAIRSSVFIGIGVSWLQAGICILRNANTASHLPGPVAAFFQVVQRSKLAWWLFSGVPAFAMLIEDESRRAEIAMYVFPKALDSAWALFRADALGLQKRRRHAWKGDVAPAEPQKSTSHDTPSSAMDPSERTASRRPAKRRSSTYYNNQVALANALEVWNNISLETGKKLVWRDHGDPPVLLENLRDCVKHGALGGLRAGSIAYGIRAGINVFLLLVRVLRYPKHFRFALIRHALFGTEPRTFGAMIGAFTALYKIILNALPILHLRWEESKSLRGNLRSSTSVDTDGRRMSGTLNTSFLLSQTELVSSPIPSLPSPSTSSGLSTPIPHLSSSTTRRLSNARERGYVFEPWQAAVAGCTAGGLAILLEKPSNRSGVGQQMFVRGLQGVYNAWSLKTGIIVPYGSVYVFGLCCAQILYAYLMKPHTLSPAYDSWYDLFHTQVEALKDVGLPLFTLSLVRIQSMSIAPLEAIKMNRSLVLEGKFDPKLLQTIVEGRSRPWNGTNSIITPANRAGMIEQLTRARAGNFSPPVISCEALHPHHTHCVPNAFIRIYECTMLLLPVYSALHLIPTLIFKRKHLLEDPLRSALKVAMGAVRSSAFIGVFVAIFQTGFCILRNGNLANLPEPLAVFFRSIRRSKLAWWLFCSLSGFSLLVENKHRREELAMYCLPKAGESAWLLFREEALGVPKRRRGAWKGDVALTSVGMGMVMTIYQTNPAALSGFVRRVLYQFIGPN